MLSNISWYSFLVFLASLVAAYYLYMVFCFYRQEIISKVSGMGKHAAQPAQHKNSENDFRRPKDESFVEHQKDNQNSFPLVHELLEELKSLFLYASGEKFAKEELIQAIGSKLKKYPLLKESDLTEDINTHLVMESKEKCGLNLEPEELKRIWNA